MPAALRHGVAPGATYRELPGTPHMQTLERPELVAGAPNPPAQEAREPGAGSRNTRRRARSSTGTGSPLRMASRRESLPHR